MISAEILILRSVAFKASNTKKHQIEILHDTAEFFVLGVLGCLHSPVNLKKIRNNVGIPEVASCPHFFPLAGKIIFQESRIAHAFAAMQHILVYIISFCLITRFTLAGAIQANITKEEKPSGK
ncbi:MAG: hypothetical protein MKZ85_09570, partial [Pedosphaera sp.]|nr:hypothetical protein [Pedosphaera sp.]